MDYKGNADKAKEPKPEKKIVKVITGEVVRKPKPVAKRMRDTFFGGDFKIAMAYVAGDVLLPALRNLLWDSISKGSERVIFGDSRFRSRPTEMRPRVSYNNPALPRAPIYADPRDRGPIHLPGQPPRYRNNVRSFSDIILVNRSDAETVVELLYDILEKYEVVSLADLYDSLEQPTSPIDNKWGWTALRNVEIRQVREGYLIELPPLEEI